MKLVHIISVTPLLNYFKKKRPVVWSNCGNFTQPVTANPLTEPVNCNVIS